jgi:hypothetical protein
VTPDQLLQCLWVYSNPALRARRVVDQLFELLERPRRADIILDALGLTAACNGEESGRQVRDAGLCTIRIAYGAVLIAQIEEANALHER